jgi:ABC-type sugar transport system ATPase subunit
MSRVELNGVTKRFGEVKALRDVTLTVEEGEFVVFVGPSGCGKSTLLRLICGIELPSEGAILFDGKDVRGLPPAGRKLAMVFQSYALYPHMTVADNMGFALRMAGVPKVERTAHVLRAAQTLQIVDLLTRLPKQLSGGQRQRVAIGRAIVREPSLFLFDEPLSNLDAELRVDMRFELADLHKRLRTSMIYVTHDQIEAMTLADRIFVMRGGVVEQMGAPQALYERPVNRFVASFIGTPRMNFLAGTVTAAQQGAVEIEIARLDPLRLTLPLAPGALANVGDAVTVGLRPDDVTIGPAGDATLEMHVESAEYVGGSTLLRETNHPAGALTVRVSGAAPVGAQPLRLGLARAKCHIFSASGERLSP